MRFFIPNLSKSEVEPAYLEMKVSLVDQLRLPIQDRRIFNLRYVNNKRDWYVEIGQPKPQENQYIVMAIFEANVFIIVNQTPSGGSGPIVLVDKSEVTAIEDFQV